MNRYPYLRHFQQSPHIFFGQKQRRTSHSCGLLKHRLSYHFFYIIFLQNGVE